MFRTVCSLVLVLMFGVAGSAQQQPTADTKTEAKVPVISGDLGDCTAVIRVTNVKMKPMYNAKISVDIKYGFAGWHHTTLEIYTNVDGKARFEGLPRKSRGPLSFTVDYKGRATAVIVEPRDNCHGSYTAILPNSPLPQPDDDDDSGNQ
jgi:hypothetical protein